MQKSFYLFFTLLSLAAAKAQLNPLDSLRKLYPDKKAVYLKQEVTLRYVFKNDSLRLLTDHHFDKCIMNENASLYSEKSVYHSGLIKLNTLAGKTIVSQGKKEKVYKNIETEVKDALEPGIFYDDLKTTKIQFPNVVPGARMVLDYQSEYLEPTMFPPVMLAAEYPILESTYTVIVPAGVAIDYSLLGISEKELRFQKTNSAKETTYQWKCSRMKDYEYYSNGPNPKKYIPQLVILLREYSAKNIRKTIKPGTKGLYEWCYSFSSKAKQNETNLLKPLVDSLTASAQNEKQKSKNIFYWVQDNIRYLAFEDGYGGYIPRHAEDIYRKKYGDCKDMANLITTMHQLAGLKAYLVWIGTREIPYSLQQVPLPCAFNHMISVVNLGNEWIYLDATGKYTHFGFPTDMIQGKETLISISKDSSLTLQVPIIEADRNVNRHQLQLSIQDNFLIGQGKRSITGLPKANFLASYHFTQTSDQNTFWSNNLRYGNNKCETSQYKLLNPDYKEEEMAVEFSIKLPDYILKVNDETFVNMNLRKDYYDSKIEDPNRTVPLEFELKSTSIQQFNLRIPAGYSISYMPEKASFEHPDFSFSIWYEKKNNEIIYNKKITLNTLEIKPSQFAEWNAMISALNKAYKESITLKK
ncbi:MAG: DUF3857 domain-containing protein [Cytophagaceae bacterium]|jgi:transglutaminase-like putative cysteine protease|nr:DUF3857 domain-containing protein [Cytophagaceae bacterium]